MTAVHHQRPTRRRLAPLVNRCVRGLSTAPQRTVGTLRYIAAESVESPLTVGAMLTSRGAQPNHGAITVQSP